MVDQQKKKRQCVWIVRYGLTEHPLVEGVGPFDSDLDPTVGMEHAQAIAERIAQLIASEDNNETLVYSSPFLRTCRTAHMIANTIAQKNTRITTTATISPKILRIEEGLTEWLNPTLVTNLESREQTFPRRVEELSDLFPTTIDLHYKSVNPPVLVEDGGEGGGGGEEGTPNVGAPKFPETEDALLTRCATTFEKILHETKSSANMVIVSHAPCDQALALHLEGCPSAAAAPKQSKLGSWPMGGITMFSRNMNGARGDTWELAYHGETCHMPGDYQHGKGAWSLPCLSSR